MCHGFQRGAPGTAPQRTDRSRSLIASRSAWSGARTQTRPRSSRGLVERSRAATRPGTNIRPGVAATRSIGRGVCQSRLQGEMATADPAAAWLQHESSRSTFPIERRSSAYWRSARGAAGAAGDIAAGGRLAQTRGALAPPWRGSIGQSSRQSGHSLNAVASGMTSSSGICAPSAWSVRARASSRGSGCHGLEWGAMGLGALPRRDYRRGH